MKRTNPFEYKEMNSYNGNIDNNKENEYNFYHSNSNRPNPFSNNISHNYYNNDYSLNYPEKNIVDTEFEI